MNPGRIVGVMILIATNNVSRSSDSEAGQKEAMLVCLLTAVQQKSQCAVRTVCTVAMKSTTQSATTRRPSERIVRWKNIVRNLACRNDGRMIQIDLEHKLRALFHAKFTTDGIHFDSIEGHAWMNRVFQVRLDELEVELFDTGGLRTDEATNVPAISIFVPPNLETRLGSVPAMPQVVEDSLHSLWHA